MRFSNKVNGTSNLLGGTVPFFVLDDLTLSFSVQRTVSVSSPSCWEQPRQAPLSEAIAGVDSKCRILGVWHPKTENSKVWRTNSQHIDTKGTSAFATRLTATFILVIIAYLVAAVGSTASGQMPSHHLEISRHGATEKVCFTLEGKPYYPILYSEHYTAFTEELFTELRQRRFNGVQLAVDSEEMTSPQFREVLSRCSRMELPVFLEIHEWSFWDVLREQPTLNMVMSDGKRVEHFPDYANPETRRLHLDCYRRAARVIAEFANRPVVAVSVGAYDAYHLPDDERHADFTVPRHDRPFQTRLPYGKWSGEAYRQYLATACVDRMVVGATDIDEPIELPVSKEDAISDSHWHRWIHFRRHLVSSWLNDTVKVVKERTGLPVGVSFDLKFALREKYATPIFEWSSIVDFLSVYCYGGGGQPSRRDPQWMPLLRSDYSEADAEYVPDLMRTVWRECSRSGVPLIGLLEFSSGLAGDTPGDAYARQCAPFVSGLMTGGPRLELKHGHDRVEEFAEWILTEGGAAALLPREPVPATVLVIVNRHRIYPDHSAQRELASHRIPFDVQYEIPSWDGSGSAQYECIVVDSDLPLPVPDKHRDSIFMREDKLPGWIETAQSTGGN